MKWMSIQKRASWFMVAAFVAFFFAASAGISHAGMSMDENGHMHECPFMGMTAICEMNPLEHITAWQARFATLTVQESLTILILALLALATPELRQRLRTPPAHQIYFFLIRKRVMPTSSNYLKEALSKGIMHPKVFWNFVS